MTGLAERRAASLTFVKYQQRDLLNFDEPMGESVQQYSGGANDETHALQQCIPELLFRPW
jgi:hypothetical protein